ncbi:MAG: 8-amino-7-oxononanoate synthase [Hyphomicrobium sp.]
MHDSHEQALKALEKRGRLRRLAPRSGIDFSSNDYLGLGTSEDLREAVAAALARGVAVGAGGSRLLRGNDPEHEALEAEAAAYFDAEAALYFGGGFTANTALFSTLPERGDVVVYDELIHASVHEGLRAGKAERIPARHNTVSAFEQAIRIWRASGGRGRPWIAAESLYSMDGDRAPLDDLSALADRTDAMLVIDEAHATGVLGSDGRGLGAHLEGRENVVSLHTCGKALGVMGALVLLPTALREFLVNRSRAFIYATAPSPLMAATVRAALQLCRDDSVRRERHAALVALANERIAAATGKPGSGSHIIPVIVGSDARATALASALQQRGFDVRAIRPPTVPEGTARVRISITLNVSEADVEALATALGEELVRLAP